MNKFLRSSTKNNWRKLQGQGVGAVLARGASSAFIIRGLGVFVAFFAHIILARFIGAEGYGNFIYAVTWMGLLVTITKLGFDMSSLRFVSEYNATEKWGLFKGFIRRSSQIVLLTSLLFAIGMAVTVYLIKDAIETDLAVLLWIVAFILPINALLLVKSAQLRALKHIVRAQAPQRVLRPVVLVIGVAFLYLFYRNNSMTATTAMIVNLSAFILMLVLSGFFLQRALPKELNSAKTEFQTTKWLKVSTPMLMIAALYQAENQNDIIILGFFLESDKVGIYGVAKRITSFIPFGAIAVNPIVAPMISELYARSKEDKLQKLLRLAAMFTSLLSLIVFFVIIVLGVHILNLFGSNFTEGYGALVILAVGFLISSLAGPVGIIMMMTGHQKIAMYNVLIFTAIGLNLNVILVPLLGIEGAAISFVFPLFCANISMLIYILIKLNLNPTIFSAKVLKN